MGIIAIVGRPNVGKSSIFNRLLGRREAIVDDMPGVTRDRLYGEISHDGRDFYIVDTGGIMGELSGAGPEIEARTREQVGLALDECDGAILVVDGTIGVTPMDREIADMLRKRGGRAAVAVNKIDDPSKMESVWEASALGFGDAIPVSAAHNFNFGELLDAAVSFLPEDDFAFEEAEDIPVAIIGRPNVGKSSLFNALGGTDRAMVSDVPGTTRDVVDTVAELDGVRFRFLDTAGLRRKARVNSSVEFYSNVRAYRAIDQCRVALAVLDASELLTEQDKRLIGQVLERGRGLVVIVNKWDLSPGDAKSGDRTRKLLRDELPFASHAPALFVSAKTGRGLGRVAGAIAAVDENRRRRIATSELNRLAREVLAFERMPGDGRGRSLSVKYCTQADGAPPAFVFFVNDPSLVTRPFERRLENILRGMADFGGVPLKLFFRERTRDRERNE